MSTKMALFGPLLAVPLCVVMALSAYAQTTERKLIPRTQDLQVLEPQLPTMELQQPEVSTTTLPSTLPPTPNRPNRAVPNRQQEPATAATSQAKKKRFLDQERRASNAGEYRYLCRTDRKQCYVRTKLEYPLYSGCTCGDFSGVTIAEQ